MTGGLLSTRRGGVLCHITSLPGPAANGTLGAGALDFLDFMQRAGLSVWQMLPLNPPDEFGSPYHSESLFALNAALLDPTLGLTSAAALRTLRRRTSACIPGVRVSASVLALPISAGSAWRALCMVQTGHRGPKRLRTRDTGRARPVRSRARCGDRSGEPCPVRDRRRICSVSCRKPHYVACCSSVTCPCTRRSRAPMSGRTRMCSCSMGASDHAVSRAYHRTTSLRRASCGAIRSTTGIDSHSDAIRWWIERLQAQLRLFDVVRIDHFRGLEAYLGHTARRRSAPRRGNGARHRAARC